MHHVRRVCAARVRGVQRAVARRARPREGPDRDRGGDPAVALAPNGPYVVRGGAELVGAELNQGGTTDHMTLCRCGASQNKPFCSGAHWNVQFDEDAPKG